VFVFVFAMRSVGLVFVCVFVSVSVFAEPISIAVGGAVLLGGGMYAFLRPAAHYKGNLDVCIASAAQYNANPWFGYSTCAYPNVRVQLGMKERINFADGFEVITSDNKRAKLYVDTVMISRVLPDVQLDLVEEYYIEEIPFKDAVLTNPIKHCIMTEIHQITYEALKNDTNLDATITAYISKCMDRYSTSFEPTRNTYVKLVRLS
jgi:hypothetical protein